MMTSPSYQRNLTLSMGHLSYQYKHQVKRSRSEAIYPSQRLARASSSVQASGRNFFLGTLVWSNG